jgi:sugar phosphate isomerase/epimerase
LSTKLSFNSYTLKDNLRSPEAIRKTLREASEIGYKSVELDLGALLMQLDRAELKAFLEEIGMRPVSAHIEFERLENDLEGTIDDCRFLGLQYVVVPNLPRDRFCKDAAGYRRGTKMLSSFAEEFKKNGMKFAYHNHGREFEKFDGKVAMDIIFEESELLSEIDVYWVQFSGGDPMYWIRKLSNRVPLVHVKDLGMLEGKQLSMEVGEGNMNWKDLLAACKDAKVEWYVVEQEDFALRSPLEGIKISRDNLKKMGVT